MERYRFSHTEQAMLDHSRIPCAVYQFINKRVITLAVSDGFMDLFGYTNRDLCIYDMDHDMYKGVHPDDTARIEEAAYRFATEGGTYETIYRSLTYDGTEYQIIHAQGEHVMTDTGVRLAYIWYMNEGSYTEDDTNHSELGKALRNVIYEESFLKASYFDHLTGLPGMTYFFDLSGTRKEELLREGRHPAMLYTDFGGMKYFNHKHGFAEGDKLLQAFARLLAQYFGNENCSHLGQDHFGAVAPEEGLEQTLESLFEDVKHINNGLSLPVHVGIYRDRLENVGPSVACDRAKLACDGLQDRYSSCYGNYEISMRDIEDRQQYIIANLDKAITERWITVYYQPIVRAVNKRVCDEEALARWIDPVRGFMSPGEFIPTLEDARLIYKLDLYIVDRVLEKIGIMKKAGHHIVPQSINLSRSDFDTCDIVEEIRRRVDDAGISRSLLTIEITESIMGTDFEFIREQVNRFKALGFSIWMDDFGSGYSNLGILQDIQFDLIKFDMRFMQQFNEGDSGKVILTELLKMATLLGVDTICEGVETEQQVQFLQETGCSKLQGYYFDKPIPVERILEKYEKGLQIGFEDPRDSQYFETIGRVNLHDLTVIAQNDSNELSKFFNTLPMAIMEFDGTDVRIVRSNHSYRKFIRQHFGSLSSDLEEQSKLSGTNTFLPFMRTIRQCAHENGRHFIDETLPDRSEVHSCVRRIAENPRSGVTAVALAVLSVVDETQGATYSKIAKALAADYFNLYYVDLETEHFIAYTSTVGDDELAVERHGEEFFDASRRDAMKYLYEDDREAFVAAFTKEHILQELDEQGTFTMTYRLLIDDEPVFVHMKIQRMPQDLQHLIIGVSNVDSQMRQKALLDKIQQDQKIYSRIMALSGDYICMYIVDPMSEHYVEYSAADVYEGLGLAKNGERFFAKARELVDQTIFPEDRTKFRMQFTKSNVMQAIVDSGLFRMQYRLMLDGVPKPVNARVALVKEDDGEKLIVGISLVSEYD